MRKNEIVCSTRENIVRSYIIYQNYTNLGVRNNRC